MGILDPKKREAILRAALMLFSKIGFEATSVAQIANEAKIATGSIYVYFQNKEEIFEALYIQCKNLFYEYLKKNYNEEANPRENFKALFQGMVLFSREEKDAFIFLEFHYQKPYLQKESLKIKNEVDSFLAKYVEDGIKKGKIQKQKPEIVIAIVYGAFVAIFKIIDSGKMNHSKKLFEEIEETLWEAIKI
ncbi:MAG: TetR/AcrR family transcriptional regulator [Leptospiraceae bacterium]|nr:TetR/AcrR family transcriptional regulator [Leptospiraceae bacterium]